MRKISFSSVSSFFSLSSLWFWVALNFTLLIWIGIQSLKTTGELFSSPLSLPAIPQWKNYINAWGVSGFGDAAFNTVVLSTACSALVVLFSAPAAYVLARSKARSAEALTSYFAIGAAIPFQTIVVPLVAVSVWLQIFMTNHVLGWWDSRITLGLFYVALSLPFSVFLLAGYFRSLPGELEEAAMLDGASPLRAFWEIMMPVARPSLTTVFLLTFVGLWNETLLVLLLVPDPELRTLPASLLSLYNTMQFTSNWGGLFAGVVILVFPIVAIYIWVGRRITEGMTAGIGK